MIKRYNDFLNEKLSDKLKGFDTEGLKKQFLNGKISFKKLLKIFNENNINNKNFLNENELTKSYLNQKIDIFDYYDSLVFLKSSKSLEIKNIIVNNLTKLSKKYKNHIENIISILKSHNITDVNEKIYDLLFFRYKNEMTSLYDIFYILNKYDFKITSEQFFSYLKYDKSFNTPQDFLKFIINSSQKKQGGDITIYQKNKITLLRIVLKNSFIYINNEIFEIFKFWFKLTNEDIIKILENEFKIENIHIKNYE